MKSKIISMDIKKEPLMQTEGSRPEKLCNLILPHIKRGIKMVTVTYELLAAIKKSGFTIETISPMVGLTAANFSQRKRARVPWELDVCYGILDILNIPRDQITRYFVGGTNKKARKT